MNVTLKELFDFYSELRPRFACTWVADNTQWWVCPCAFMSRFDKSLKNSPVQGYNGKPSNKTLEEHPEKVYPENTIKVIFEGVSEHILDIIYTGSKLISRGGKLCKDVDLSIPHGHFNLLAEKIRTGWDSFDKVDFCVYKSALPLLRISQGDSTLWVVYNNLPKEDNLAVTTENGTTYRASQWSDEEKQYKKFTEERMDFTPNTKKIVEGLIGKEFDKIKIDPEKPGKDIKVEASEAAAAPAPATPPVPAAVPAQEAPKEEPAVQVKKTRKKAEVTQLTDLTKVIDQLGGAIPEDVSDEKTIEQIRQLRDIQIAASRRAANLALQFIEKNKGAEAKLAAIRAAL